MAAESRRGIALLEVLLALAIATSAGLGWLALARQSLHALETVREREITIRAATRILGRYAAMDAAGLAASAGRFQEASFRIDVSMLADGLFEVSVFDRKTSERLLFTSLYRPEAANHAR